MAPMMLMKTMAKDEKVKNLVETAEVFFNSIAELETLFSGNYDGGDFCTGLIFGRAGSKMLVEIAGKMFQLPDEHNPALKEKHPKGRVTNEFLERDRQRHKQSTQEELKPDPVQSQS